MPKAPKPQNSSHRLSPSRSAPPMTPPGKFWAPILLAAYKEDPEEFDTLIVTNQASALESRVASLLNPAVYTLPTQSKGSFLPWAYATLGRSGDRRLATVLATRKTLKETTRHEVRGLTHSMFIYKSPAKYAILLGFAHLGIDRVAQEYPPRNHWVASTKELFDMWESYLKNYEQPDKRLARHPLFQLDTSKLQMSIPEELSCCLYDKKTSKVVFVVIRKFANHRAILAWAKALVHRAAITCKSIRLEDSGSLIQVMYSAGSRSAPAFGIVRNVTASLTEEEKLDANRDIASLFSYVWLRAKGLFPPEIIEDFEKFYARYNIPRFDPEWPHSRTASGPVKLPYGLGSITFSDVERAPGLGVLHDRYARAVHHEYHGHRWAISWMSNRWGLNPVGGHFYLCTYALESRAHEDSAWAWCPREWHATGVSNFEPTFDIPQLFDEVHNQCGVAFVSSSRVSTVYNKWAKKRGLSGKDKVTGALAELDSPPPPECLPEEIYV